MSFNAPTLPLNVHIEAGVRLGGIESKEQVKVIFAVESGSRAWGFPSPDSDNDVRFFYVRLAAHYLGLDDPRDVIEPPIDGLWDLSGWDLKKALKLLVKGNATVAEWLSSPLIYLERGAIPFRLRDLIKRHATAEMSARHYYGLTKNCYAGEIGNRPNADRLAQAFREGHTIKGLTAVNLKKYLYAIRGAASISWIKRYGDIPPMSMPALMSHDILPDQARDLVNTILARKATMGEFGQGERIIPLDAFIEEMMAWVVERGFNKLENSPAFAAEANTLLLEAIGVPA